MKLEVKNTRQIVKNEKLEKIFEIIKKVYI